MIASAELLSRTSSPKPKRILDVEQALQWAFRDELPKRDIDRPITARRSSGVHPMWRGGVFGGRVDNWNHSDPGFPLAMGEPHPDALVIEAAVKGLKPEDLDLWGFLIPYRLGDSFDLAGILEKARSEVLALVVTRATSRTRPDTSDLPEVEAVRSITGQITVWVREAREYEEASGKPIIVTHDLPTKPLRKGIYPNGAFSKIRYTPSAASVALDRAQYAAWWAALAHIAETLRMVGLESIEITGPDAPPSPWTEAAPAEPAPVQVVPSLLPTRALLKERRLAGRRQMPRRNSPVRQIFPAPEEAGIQP